MHEKPPSRYSTEFLLKEEAPRSVRPYAFILEALDLAPLDWMTLRDLLELDQALDDTPLIVVLALMLAAMREGSLCLELTDDHVGRLVGRRHLALINDPIAQFLDQQKQMRYQDLITTGESVHFPLIFETVAGIDRLYFQKYYLHEKRLRRRIDAFLCVDISPNVTPQTARKILKEIGTAKRCLRLAQDGRPFVHDPEQKVAIVKALSSPFTIISGGPGTGKTSVMVNILRGLVRTGIPASKIALAAPTGRAAQRMTEAVARLFPTIRSPSDEDRQIADLKGSTLHKRLRYRRSRHDFYYSAQNPIPVNAVIVDEVSMVDVVMLARFLEALDPRRTRLILMGDKDQLPSVEAGAVFAEMIPTGDRAAIFKDRLVVLTHGYRSGKNINRLAATINQGQMPTYQPVSFTTALEKEPDCWSIVAPLPPSAWQTCIKKWVADYFLKSADSHRPGYPDLLNEAAKIKRTALLGTTAGKELLVQLFKFAEQSKILTLLRHGPWGCNRINAGIEHHLTEQTAEAVDPATGLFPGALIMVTRNDYAKGLFNGDMGVVLGDGESGLRAFFQRGDTHHDFAVGQLPPWESAFAVTVHKSQGSEFDDVWLVLPEDSGHRLLTREILYTAVTRARKRVIIYGSRASIDTAVSRKIARQSGLVWEKE